MTGMSPSSPSTTVLSTPFPSPSLLGQVLELSGHVESRCFSSPIFTWLKALAPPCCRPGPAVGPGALCLLPSRSWALTSGQHARPARTRPVLSPGLNSCSLCRASWVLGPGHSHELISQARLVLMPPALPADPTHSWHERGVNAWTSPSCSLTTGWAALHPRPGWCAPRGLPSVCPFTCEGGEGGRLTLTGCSHSARLELRLEGDGPGGPTLHSRAGGFVHLTSTVSSACSWRPCRWQAWLSRGPCPASL